MSSRIQSSRDNDFEAAGDLRGRRHRDNQIKFFTIAETAEMLRVGPRTVRRQIAAGELVAHRLGGCVRIAEADLRAFLAVHRQG